MTPHSNESLPLEIPPEGRLWHRASAVLEHHIAATALMTMGWRGVPRVTLEDRSATGGARIAWFMAARPGVPGLSVKDARMMLLSARDRSKQSLAAMQPDAPFLAALAALENLAGLMIWQKTGRDFEVTMLPQCRFFSLLSDHPDRVPMQHKAGGGYPVHDGLFAAALIACGFSPVNAMGLVGPVLSFPHTSLTFPDMIFPEVEAVAHQMREAYGRRGIKPPFTLPGYPAEEHPFFYAYHAVLNYAPHRDACVQAARNPDRFLRNPTNSQRTAIVTASLTETGNDRLRRALAAHLSKQY